VWHDQHEGSELNYVHLYDAHRKEKIKHVTRKNLALAASVLDRIKSVHRERHSALH
jgi:hypothetical protein